MKKSEGKKKSDDSGKRDTQGKKKSEGKEKSDDSGKRGTQGNTRDQSEGKDESGKREKSQRQSEVRDNEGRGMSSHVSSCEDLGSDEDTDEELPRYPV